LEEKAHREDSSRKSDPELTTEGKGEHPLAQWEKNFTKRPPSSIFKRKKKEAQTRKNARKL